MKSMQDELTKNRPASEDLENSVKDKAQIVAAIEADLAKSELKIFKDFSQRVGVANIREFENERLKLAEQYHNEKVRLTTEQTNLQNQLDYERQRDVGKTIEQVQNRLKELEAKLATAKKEEAKIEDELSKDREKVEALLEEGKKINKEMEKKQADLKDAKKKAADVESEVFALDKHVSSLRSSVTSDQMRRHEMLHQAKVEDVELPLLTEAGGPKRKKQKRGERKEEEEEEEDEDEDIEMGDENDTNKELAAESKLRFDFSELDDSFIDPDSTPSQLDRLREEFKKVLEEHAAELERRAPNLKAIEKFAGVSDKFAVTKAEWEKKKSALQAARDAFDFVKEERNKTFLKAYKHISTTLGHIYTQLTMSSDFPTGGKAYLSLDSNDEPYLSGKWTQSSDRDC